METGAQLYTLRAFCGTPDGLARSLERVAEIGYRTVQVSGTCPWEAEWLKAQLKKNGLRCAVTHIPAARLESDPAGVAADHAAIGCRYAGLGYLPDRYHSPDWLPRFAVDFGPAAERLRAAGMKLMYHNHCFEFERLPGGDTMMDRLLAMMPADLMGLTADTYWLQYGGVDVNRWLKEHAERLHCVHLKDYGVKGFTVRMEAVGSGNLDFPAILETLRNNGVTEYALVEQDDCNGESPFTCLKRSLDYLRALSE